MKTLEQLGISPAPWNNRVGDFTEDAKGFLIEIDEGYVLRMGDTPNARLIAAAPELYEALRECEQKIDAIDPYCNLLSDVREVLSKAGGAE